jgi:hypothetical protein
VKQVALEIILPSKQQIDVNEQDPNLNQPITDVNNMYSAAREIDKNLIRRDHISSEGNETYISPSCLSTFRPDPCLILDYEVPFLNHGCINNNYRIA